MMFNQRTNCVYRKMKEMISCGELGSIQPRQLADYQLVPPAELL